MTTEDVPPPDRSLPPEACLDLQIHLDRLERAGEQCREGIRRLMRGQLTHDAYLDLVRRQQDAQDGWEGAYRKYFSVLHLPADRMRRPNLRPRGPEPHPE